MSKDNRLLALLVVIASAPEREDGAELIKLAQKAMEQYKNARTVSEVHNTLMGLALNLAGALDVKVPKEYRVALLKKIFLPIFDMEKESSNEGN